MHIATGACEPLQRDWRYWQLWGRRQQPRYDMLVTETYRSMESCRVMACHTLKLSATCVVQPNRAWQLCVSASLLVLPCYDSTTLSVLHLLCLYLKLHVVLVTAYAMCCDRVAEQTVKYTQANKCAIRNGLTFLVDGRPGHYCLRVKSGCDWVEGELEYRFHVRGAAACV